jgi:hypothetical protein
LPGNTVRPLTLETNSSRPFLALAHLREDGLGDADRPGGVLRVEALDLGWRAGLDCRAEDDARVRDEDVDLAGLRDGGVDAGLVGHVQAQPLVDLKAIQGARVPRGRDHAMTAEPVRRRWPGRCPWRRR